MVERIIARKIQIKIERIHSRQNEKWGKRLNEKGTNEERSRER